jgi:putative ABC transport system permease protein
VPPISAVREGATLPRSRFAPYMPWLAGVVVIGALLLLSRAMFTDELGTGDRLLSIAGGVLLLFLGVAMLSSHLVKPIAAVVGTPARRAGGAAGRLASGNSVRNPSRTAATAAALMIGIALVAFIATLTNGMKASNREAIEEQIAADYVVTSSDGYTPFVAAAGDSLAASGGAEMVTSVRTDGGLVNGATTEVGGIDPDSIADAYVFDWKDGDENVLGTLGMDKAIVTANYADDHELAVGDTIELRSTADRSARLTVAGTFEPAPFYPLLGSVNVSTERFDSLYDRPRNQFTWANVAGDPNDENRAQLEAALAGFPDTQLETREQWIQREDADFNEFISFLYVMLTLAVFVSVFGMINTLVLSVYERTREIGMLRAIGMTRRQVRRMIRQESIITALIGAAIGLPLGIFLAALVNRALSEFDVRFAIPWGQLIVLTIVAIVIGVLAAIMPARRAAKLNPLEAIAYE